MKPLSENGASDLAVKLYSRHIIPGENWERDEMTVRMSVADLYLAGYCVAEPDTETKTEWKTGLTKGDIKRMKEEGVIY